MSDSHQAPCRGVIGIDLGTSNSVIAWAPPLTGDALDAPAPMELVGVPQIIAAGTVESRAALPSFLYVPSQHEMPEGALDLPWEASPRVTAGTFARDHGGKVPHRLVSSAKSWLCHDGVDRRAPILPWANSEEGPVPKVSPVLASAKYLQHMRCAFQHAHADAPLDGQDVVLCVPASFDPAARDLTVEAARAAGLAEVTLLEEPQAALYAWLEKQGDSWRDELVVGDVVLVCDVGGGTTDFSLIAISEADGSLLLERIAVGDHILLGGDNMDYALAYRLKQDMEQEHKVELDRWQLMVLVQSARAGKETLLGPGAPERYPVMIPNRGARFFKRNLKAELTRKRVLDVVVDGFFPESPATDRPRAPRRTGLTQLGLPYAADPAITRHLAAFLAAHRDPGSGRALRHPTAVLFNGGVLKAAPLRDRILGILTGWLLADGGAAPKVLESADPDAAVARGAAYFGRVRAGRGVRIRGGTARSYYVGIEQPMPAVPGFEPPIMAVCVAPFGMEEGSTAPLPGERFGLVTGEPARFRFFQSGVRKSDEVGTVLETWEAGELTCLPPIEAEMSPREGGAPGSVVEVGLEAAVTAVGTLELHCVSAAASPGGSPGRWKLELSLRRENATEDVTATPADEASGTGGTDGE